MYNTVFLQDLEKVVKVLTEKIPNFSTFSSIVDNCEGNFVVKKTDVKIDKPNRFPPLSQNGLNPFHRLLPASRFRVDSDGSRSSRSSCSCHTTSDVVCFSVEIFSDDIASSFLTLHAWSKRREQIIVFA